MTNMVLLGIVAALFTGIAIGTQSTLSGRIGGIIGNFKTGVLMNVVGGSIAGLILITMIIIKDKGFWQFPAITWTMLIIAGALGVLIVTGVSYSLQKTGVAAGMATIILGQLVISLIIDAKGWGGLPPIPITWPRILGLLVMAAGLFLLLPKKG